jgi:RimJ/RimL family protein N-acetyltransferase
MAVLPIDTERTQLRVMTVADAPALASYRSLPEVARFQSWTVPFTVEQAEQMLAGQSELTDVTPDEWVQIAIVHGGVVVGDVAVGLEGADVATIGYTLHPDHQGKGLASEAVAAVVDALFVRGGVRRIQADTDPRNHASMRVIESLGFRYEGRLRGTAVVDGEPADDLRFGLLAADRVAWLARPRTRPEHVELAEITEDLLRPVRALGTHWFQREFVAPVDQSLAQALVPGDDDDGHPVVPWFRAVVADGEVVGFVMVAEPQEHSPEPYLWRLLVDRRHQRLGIGDRVLDLLIERYRAEGRTSMLVSWYPAPGGPEPFYLRRGFVPTGVIEDEEVEARLVL